MTEITQYVEITYDYQGEHKASFEKLNRILSRLKLSHLELSEFDGHPDGRLCPGRRSACTYVPDYGKLTCTLSKQGHIYQIDALVEITGDADKVVENWREANPDRALRTHIKQRRGKYYCHIFLHHPRITEPNIAE